jgi:Flp pilus assembly protein TadD
VAIDSIELQGIESVIFENIDVGLAVPSCRKSLAQNPNEPRLMVLLARVLAKNQEYAEAISLYRQAAIAGNA